MVYCELRRRTLDIYFHKKKAECDFVIKKELRIVEAIQVCVHLEDLQTREREIQGLVDAMESYDLQAGLILTQREEGTEIFTTKEGKKYCVKIQPVWKWLLTNDVNGYEILC
jgi:hypothetical protein